MPRSTLYGIRAAASSNVKHLWSCSRIVARGRVETDRVTDAAFQRRWLPPDAPRLPPAEHRRLKPAGAAASSDVPSPFQANSADPPVPGNPQVESATAAPPSWR